MSLAFDLKGISCRSSLVLVISSSVFTGQVAYGLIGVLGRGNWRLRTEVQSSPPPGVFRIWRTPFLDLVALFVAASSFSSGNR